MGELQWCCPCGTLVPPAAEHVGEIPALNASRIRDKDIKPALGQWKWTPEQPWPPVEVILRTAF